MRALLLVDIQNDFCAGGALAVPDGDAVVDVANELMDSGSFDLIVASKDWHPQNHASFASNHAGAKVYDTVEIAGAAQVLWPDHCVQNTHGAEFHPNLKAQKINEVIYKGQDPRIDSYSAFYDNDHANATGLTKLLRSRNIKEVVIAGLATDYCVQATAIDARSDGFEVVLVKQGCRAVDPTSSVSEDIYHELEHLGCSCIDHN